MNNPLQLCIITSSGNKSGGTRQAVYQADTFAQNGHLVLIFAPKNSSAKKIAPHLNWRVLPNSLLTLKKSIEAEINPNLPCIVHGFHNKSTKMLSFLGILWAWQKRKIICLGHRGVIFKPNNPLPYLLPGIKAFTANSALCADIIKKACFGLKPVHIVYNSIPKERLNITRDKNCLKKQLSIPEHYFVFGSIASDAEVKGMQILLPAFAKANLSNSILLLVGLTPEYWQAEAEKLKIKEKVRILSGQDDIANYLQLMDFFIIPSLTESQPNTLLEAMSLGLPAAGSKVGGIPELINDPNDIGLLLKPGCIEELSELLKKIYRLKPADLTENIIHKINNYNQNQYDCNYNYLSELGKLNREFAVKFESQTRYNHLKNIYAELISNI